MTNDRPLLGIALMTGFCALAPLGDSIAKILGDTVPLIQLLLVRFALQGLLLLPWVGWRTIRPALSRRFLWLTGLRTVFHMIGIGAMFASLRYLPLADAIAIAFVMPFIMLLLGKLVLKEEVGPRRLAACAVGFAGTLLVIQPSFQTVGWPALLPLVVAVAFSFFMLVTRQLARESDPIALQAVSGLMASVVLAVAVGIGWRFAIPHLTMIAPDATEIALLATIGVLGTLAHLLMTWSLRFAPASTLAPMQYLEIPFATVIGWVIFRDLPNGLAALGIAITVAAGLYIVVRERSLARAQKTVSPAAAE